MADDVQGVNATEVTDWLAARTEVATPLSFTLIAGGHSNLTFGVTDADGRKFVLRRPPLGQVLATAHDMGREHRIIAALADTPVPVPPVVGLSADDSINGAPFYVMEFVDGLVVRDAETAKSQLTVEARRAAGESIAQTMAEIHAVDPDAVGLGDLGRKDGYIARQLKRWFGQWEKSKMEENPLIDSVYDRLLRGIPEQQGTAIVHGDYRLDNCMMGTDGQIQAVLDWELCTLGDAMADVGLLMVYWNEATDSSQALLTSPTAVEGFPTRAEMLDTYAKASGRDLSQVGYYTAFGYWKLACIVQGVYARYVGGAMGDRDSSSFEGFRLQVLRLAESADQALQSMGSNG